LWDTEGDSNIRANVMTPDFSSVSVLRAFRYCKSFAHIVNGLQASDGTAPGGVNGLLTNRTTAVPSDHRFFAKKFPGLLTKGKIGAIFGKHCFFLIFEITRGFSAS